MRMILAIVLVVQVGGVAGAQTTRPVSTRAVDTMAAQSQPAQGRFLRQVGAIPMPGVRGRLDHLAIDPGHGQLFVAALGNNSIEVLDLAGGKRLRSVPGFDEPQGLLYLADQDLLVVTNGKTGLVQFLDRASLKEKARVKLADDADNIRYEPTTRRIYVGYGDGLIVAIDAVKHEWAKDISLSGHPESFQIDSEGSRIYINVPAGPHVSVLDLKTFRTIAKWPLEDAGKNYPMALDRESGRLLVGCREPAVLLTLDTQTGEVVDRITIDGDADDIFQESAAKRLYVSCGAGYLDVLEQDGSGRYRMVEQLPTGQGARTCLFVPQSRRLYLAVPQREGAEAEVRVYEAAAR